MKNNNDNNETKEKKSKFTKEQKRKMKRALYLAAILSMYIIVEYYRAKHGQNVDINNTNNTTTETTIDNDEENINNNETITLSNLEVQFVDVGQADCILISTNGEYMLIDAGNNADGKKLVQYFKDLGISKFEYVVGTHAHEDHIGGMDDIIDNFDIDTFYMPNALTTSKTFEDVLDSLAAKNYYLDTPAIGDKFQLGEGEFRVVYVSDNDKELNDSSIVLRLDFGEMSYLFTGDASSTVEKLILDDDIDIDVLKVGHHGSHYSSSKEFIEACSPQYAFIEVGEGNKYKHPTTEVLERLEEYNIEYYRTDYEGTIITETDGKTLSLRKVKTDTDGNRK